MQDDSAVLYALLRLRGKAKALKLEKHHKHLCLALMAWGLLSECACKSVGAAQEARDYCYFRTRSVVHVNKVHPTYEERRVKVALRHTLIATRQITAHSVYVLHRFFVFCYVASHRKFGLF